MKDSGFDYAALDDLSYRLTCGVALVRAVLALLENGDDRPGDCDFALFGAVLYLRGIDQELWTMVESAP